MCAPARLERKPAVTGALSKKITEAIMQKKRHHRRFMDAAGRYQYEQMRNIERRKIFEKWGMRIGVIIAMVMAAIVAFLYLT